MPPAKAAKKAAKKVANQPHAKHAKPKDLRRAYEHLGRVETLRRALNPPAAGDNIHALVALAEGRLGDGHRGDAADLLRAAEHLSFAALADRSKESKVSEELHAIILKEIDHLTEKANDHWDENKAGVVSELFHSSRDGAVEAFEKGAYHQALELARAAESLSHVKTRKADKLESGSRPAKHAKP